jgi:hypothetical protein
MEPITWEWVAKEQTKSLREWEALQERMQPHLDSLKKYIELPERRILYQVDDAIRNDIIDAVNASSEHLSTITVQLGAHWTPPNPGTHWPNAWPDRKFLIEGFCSLPAWQTLMMVPHEQKEGRKFAQRFPLWVQSEISAMIETVWTEWIKKMIPNDIRSIKVDHQRRPRSDGHVKDLEYSIHVEFTRPVAVLSLYEPLAPVKGREH